MEEEARKQLASDIIAIMEAYGISDFNINDKLNRSVKTLASNKIATLLRINYRHIQNVGKTSLAQYLEEVPLLIQFLRACEGSVIQLKGTITNPRGKQIKGTETYAKLSYPHFLTGLEMFTNTWLEKEQDGLFQYEFGWKDKEPITWTETKTSGSNTEEYEYNEEGEVEDTSWKMFFKNMGYDCDNSTMIEKGLLELPSIRQIWMNHTKDAISGEPLDYYHSKNPEE